MTNEIFTYDNYILKFTVNTTQIKLNMTDNTTKEIYEGVVEESNITVKPIKKFYSMIIRALNKEHSYNFSITNNQSDIVCCNFSYNTDMVDIDEFIIINKISAGETKELLLVERIKELEDMLTPIFGHLCSNEQYKSMKFDLNTKVLDFRPFNLIPTNNGSTTYEDKYCVYYNSNVKCARERTGITVNTNKAMEFNKFKHVKEIIYDFILSPVYFKSIIDFDKHQDCTHSLFIFNSKYLYLPSVTELKIYMSQNCDAVNGMRYSHSPEHSCRTSTSLPNIEKLSIINNTRSLIEMKSGVNLMGFIKLKHLVLKNISLLPIAHHKLTVEKQIKVEYIS